MEGMGGWDDLGLGFGAGAAAAGAAVVAVAAGAGWLEAAGVLWFAAGDSVTVLQSKVAQGLGLLAPVFLSCGQMLTDICHCYCKRKVRPFAIAAGGAGAPGACASFNTPVNLHSWGL